MTDFIRIEENPAHGEIHGYGVACLATRSTPVPPEELRSFAASLMTAVASGCVAKGAKDIGHIKAYVEHATGFLAADTLGDPADLTVEGKDGEPATTFRLVINSVIYGLSREAVARVTEDALKQVFQEHGLSMEPENHSRSNKTER
ncbi:MAG: hypothetical protein P8013_10790 [Candidatus Sulfobium sp.]|jgi:hypothetical protein